MENYAPASLSNAAHPMLQVLLPDFGPKSLPYTPLRLQAVAELIIGRRESNMHGSAAGLPHLREAVRLGPDLAATHFYLAEELSESGYTRLQSIPEYRRAVELAPDDPDLQRVADTRLSWIVPRTGTFKGPGTSVVVVK